MKIAGKPAMKHIVDRLKASALDVIIATPEGQGKLFCGPEATVVEGRGICDESPLHRMANVVRHLTPSPEWIIRITHDDILIDPETISHLIYECRSQGAGYGCTPTIVEGAGVEVIHRDNLLAAAERRKEPTEFVSYFVRGEGMPRPGIVRMRPRESIERPYRLTLDYHEDALVLEAVLRAVGPDASLDAIVSFIDTNKSLLSVNKLPDISFYTCAYNSGAWLKQAIHSAVLFPSSEYVVVNDGSTDATLASALYYSKIVSILSNEENIGLASSSNKAISECKGKTVMRIDADDYLTDDACAHLPKMLQMIKDGFNVVYPAYYLVNAEGAILGQAGEPRTHHHVGGALFDKAFLNELRFKEGIRNWDGLELYQRMVKAGAKIGYYDKPTWCYRQHDKSMSRTNTSQREKEKDEIVKAQV